MLTLLLLLLLLLHVTGTRGVATERQPSTRNFLRKIGDGIKDFGHDIADGAKDLGHNIEGGFKRIGHGVMATQHLQGNGGGGGGTGKEDEEEGRDPKGGPHGGQIGSGGGAEVVPSEKAIPPIVRGSARQSLIPPLRKHNSVIRTLTGVRIAYRRREAKATIQRTISVHRLWDLPPRRRLAALDCCATIILDSNAAAVRGLKQKIVGLPTIRKTEMLG